MPHPTKSTAKTPTKKSKYRIWVIEQTFWHNTWEPHIGMTRDVTKDDALRECAELTKDATKPGENYRPALYARVEPGQAERLERMDRLEAACRDLMGYYGGMGPTHVPERTMDAIETILNEGE